MKHNDVKYCGNPACGMPLRKGRADLKFCDAKCRSANYQQLHKDTIDAEKALTKGNRINEKVLKLLRLRIPRSKQFPGYVDISTETLVGAGYDMQFFGMPKMVKWDNKNVQSYYYYKIILIAHPEHENRYLIAYKNENT
jgi:hypothetical protein